MTDTNPIGFASCTLDRCDQIRVDPVALAECFKDPSACRIILRGLDPLVGEGALARQEIPADAKLNDHAFLGKLADGRPLFAELRTGLPHGAQYAPRVWEAASELSAEELSLYGATRSLVDWHARHGFCAVCGGQTSATKGGWSRQCEACGAEHFPRVDPVVIMLAEYEDRVLVGRQPRFPAKRYSALAGFVEPGETIEGAVARELFEEAGIRVSDISYVMSQPWPFPSSLMIACTARAESDALTLDEQELEHAFWASVEDVRLALAGAETAPFIAPPMMAVAHHLLKHWLETKD